MFGRISHHLPVMPLLVWLPEQEDPALRSFPKQTGPRTQFIFKLNCKLQISKLPDLLITKTEICKMWCCNKWITARKGRSAWRQQNETGTRFARVIGIPGVPAVLCWLCTHWSHYLPPNDFLAELRLTTDFTIQTYLIVAGVSLGDCIHCRLIGPVCKL